MNDRDKELDDDLADQLDARLRAAFAPPSDRVLANTARAAIGNGGKRYWPWLAAAAAAALVLITWWAQLASTLRDERGPEGHDAAQLGALWAAAYEHAEARGFGTPDCCDPGQDFGLACERSFAVKLGVGDGIELLGCYCGLPTGGCVAALTRSANGPVGVFVLPRRQDPEPQLPPNSTLQLTRRELGPVVLYAVCRGPASESLAQFRLAP
jgi:hypothetical protein